VIVDGTSGIRISAMVLATCSRAGLKHPAAIPMLLYPDDVSARQTFTDNPSQDARHAEIQATLKMHKTQREVYREQSGDEPSILMAMLTNAATSSGHSLSEFLSGEEEFPLPELFEIASACGHFGLILAAVDENEARNVVADSQSAPWDFEEAGHVNYTDSLLQGYQTMFQVELT